MVAKGDECAVGGIGSGYPSMELFERKHSALGSVGWRGPAMCDVGVSITL